ncbi:uncharacterized protein LOC105389986 [Plutella xylostella]|uniref:uncharacterized protein LOC105389986 n=1 Tax=Plutella xylostella TaxID=51655 RepID=UPI002032BE2B|nr:uncharacterized protein LOC105389986 [Plutella xylostella]
MFLFKVSLLSLLSITSAFDHRSAASDAQIRFAVENKYDDTGPGATKPEYAYKTYKHLDDALAAYVDDPDTKLSEYDKARAYQRLGRPINIDYSVPKRTYPQYEQNAVSFVSQTANDLPKEVTKDPGLLYGFLHDSPRAPLDLRGFKHVHVPSDHMLLTDREPFQLRQIKYVKESPLNLAHYRRQPEDKAPKYSYAYKVHDGRTGDSKMAHESRSGDVVRGYYRLLDADNKVRTVRYTASDAAGFQAQVERTRV